MFLYALITDVKKEQCHPPHLERVQEHHPALIAFETLPTKVFKTIIQRWCIRITENWYRNLKGYLRSNLILARSIIHNKVIAPSIQTLLLLF